MRFLSTGLLTAFCLASLPAGAQSFDASKVAHAARQQIGVTVNYDPAYVRLAYPGGDVPIERGVCSDVIVRAFRATHIDLQRLVHEDMQSHFSAYPKNWGLSKPDSNIDHRRVPNLERFFQRQGKSLVLSTRVSDYLPGDVISWRLDNGLAHIGIVSDRWASDGSKRPLVIHNIGSGARQEDVLFAWRQVGHYRWQNFSAASTANRGAR